MLFHVTSELSLTGCLELVYEEVALTTGGCIEVVDRREQFALSMARAQVDGCASQAHSLSLLEKRRLALRLALFPAEDAVHTVGSIAREHSQQRMVVALVVDDVGADDQIGRWQVERRRLPIELLCVSGVE